MVGLGDEHALLRLKIGSFSIGRFSLGEQLPEAGVFFFNIVFKQFSFGFFTARDFRDAKLMVVYVPDWRRDSIFSFFASPEKA